MTNHLGSLTKAPVSCVWKAVMAIQKAVNLSTFLHCPPANLRQGHGLGQEVWQAATELEPANSKAGTNDKMRQFA